MCSSDLREKELAATFEGLPDFNQRQVELQALQARMDAARPGSAAYADLEAQVKKAQEELTKARETQEAVDAARAAGHPFATAADTKSGLLTSKTRITQPVTEETLSLLNISPRTNLGQSLLGLDLNTVRGANQFIATMEDPAMVGAVNVDTDAYLGIRSELEDVLARAKPKGAQIGRAHV